MTSSPDLSCDPMESASAISTNIYRLQESIRKKRYLPPTPVDLTLIHQHNQQIARNPSLSSGSPCHPLPRSVSPLSPLTGNGNDAPFRPRGYTMPSYIGTKPINSGQIRQRSMSACSKRSSLLLETTRRPQDSQSTSPGSSELFSKPSSGDSSPSVFKPCRIIIAGFDNVGKKSIMESLIKTHYSALYEPHLTNETIKIKLGAEYYEFYFETLNSSKDLHFIEKQVRKKDAMLVVFSSIERKSFENAAQLLVLTKLNIRKPSPVIVLVANKIDLERAREVSSEEAKKLAARFEVKYIEISAILDYNTDNLLKQLSKQIWLNSSTEHNVFNSNRSLKSLITGSTNDIFSNIGRKLSGKVFDRLWKGSKFWSKSCETLESF